jgi:hypothetical protein
MAKQNINVGTAANDKKGDSLRAAFQKVNANFTELYTELGLVNDVTLSLGAFEFVGSTLSTTDSSAIVIDQATTITSNLSVGGDILPQTAHGGDLGSSTLPWRSLYVSNNTIYIGGVPLGIDANGALTVNGSQIAGGSVSSLVNGANTLSLGSNGVLTLPNSAIIRDSVDNALAIGVNAGNITAQNGAIAIGQDAGSAGQGYDAIAIGSGAGGGLDLGFQGQSAIAIGSGAGADSQGVYSIAIGDSAGQTNQAPGTIILNATAYALNGVVGQPFSFYVAPIRNASGTSGLLQYNSTTKEVTYSSDIRSEGNINIDINLADSTLRRWQFGEDGLLTFPDGTNQSTAYTSVYAQSGATSAYATQRVLQYNPSTNAVTYSNTLDAVRAYITGYSSEIHVSPVAADDTGNGTIGDPVKTIARAQALAALAFETTGAGQRKSIILHPGDYVEDVTISTQYTVLTTHELVGKNTTLSGTLTITKGCTIDGLKMTNLVISATSAFGSVDIIGCTITTATTKTSTAYTVFRGCDLSTSTLSITGGGTTALIGGNYFTLAVNNAAAGVLAKTIVSMGPVTLTAGTLQLSDTLIYSATNTSYAITQSAYSVITINNCQTLIPDLSNVSRISLNGFYSILSAVYDKPNSILAALSATGGSLSSIIYDQYINADRLILSTGGQITFPDATVQTTAWTGSAAAGTLTGTALASGVVSSSLTSVGTLGTLAVTGAVTAETFNTDQITVVGNRISTTVTNANLEIECNGTGGVVINTVAEATTASTARSAGYLGIPASTVSTTATLTIADAGEHIYVTTTGQTITIPAASSVAYPIGTTITFIAGPSATTVTIAIATDTLRLAGGTSTGSRTLAANGMATAVKVSGTSSSGVWYINGTGLT